MRSHRRALGSQLLLGLAALAVLATSSAAADPGPHVAVYLTTKDLKATLARQSDLAFEPGAPGGTNDVTVDPGTRYQTLTAGFGVAMTDSSAYVLDRGLPPGLRDQAMRDLFSSQDGIGLSFLRVPIAGSDYVVGAPYSYDDMPPGQTDPTLAHFSVAHDVSYLFPMIRQALALNPRISLMANPWSPPAWMKADDKLVSVGPDGTLLPQYYGTYANYLVKSVQAYGAAGVPVHYLGVQNEPYTPLLLVSGIPNSYLSGADEGNLIHTDVVPALRQAGLAPRIVAYDDGFQRSETFIPAAMQIAGSDIAGLAYHCYLSDPSSMTTEHMLYPSEPALETECSSDLSNIEPAQMTIRVLRNWAQGVQLWNAALNQSYGPKVGNGCAGLPGTGPHAGQQCIAPVIVDTTKHSFSLTSDYWALAHFSKFIHLGAQRIASSTPSNCQTSPAPPGPCGLEDVAFRNPDGSEVLVATTNDGQPHTLAVTENGKSFSYTVPDGATVTFVWPASASSGAPSAGGAANQGRVACARPSLTFHVHRLDGRPIVRVLAYVNGRRVRTVRRRSIVHVRLRRPRARTYTVEIVSLTRGGAARITLRRYRPCAKTAPRRVARRRRRRLAATGHVSATSTSPEAHVACGTERWAVKTLTDVDANRVDLTPKPSSVARLRQLAAPSALPPRRLPQELQSYRISARLLAFKFESDGDVHLVVADPHSGGTMIVELPNSGCTHGAPATARHRIAQAKRALLSACGTPSSSRFTTLTGTATIAGVLFFDFAHGQRGVAPNAVELHPVTSFSSSNCRVR